MRDRANCGWQSDARTIDAHRWDNIAAHTPLYSTLLHSTPDAHRSGDLRLALSVAPIRAERRHCRQARDGGAMAPRRLPLILALEVSHTRRSPTNPERAAPPHPRYEPCQCAVGRAAHSWRVAQTRHRGRPVDRGQVHGARTAAAEPELEDLSAQPRGRHRRHGPARGADDRLPLPLCAGHPRPPPTTDPIVRCHVPSDGGLDRSADHRCISVD